MRDAQIAAPKMGELYIEGTLGIHETGWVVCFRANSKNRMGAYTGLRDTALLIRGDRVLVTRTNDDGADFSLNKLCRDEKYEPFPEIEEKPRQPAGR